MAESLRRSFIHSFKFTDYLREHVAVGRTAGWMDRYIQCLGDYHLLIQSVFETIQLGGWWWLVCTHMADSGLPHFRRRSFFLLASAVRNHGLAADG